MSHHLCFRSCYCFFWDKVGTLASKIGRRLCKQRGKWKENTEVLCRVEFLQNDEVKVGIADYSVTSEQLKCNWRLWHENVWLFFYWICSYFFFCLLVWVSDTEKQERHPPHGQSLLQNCQSSAEQQLHSSQNQLLQKSSDHFCWPQTPPFLRVLYFYHKDADLFVDKKLQNMFMFSMQALLSFSFVSFKAGLSDQFSDCYHCH